LKELFIINKYARCVVEILSVSEYDDCLTDIGILRDAIHQQHEFIELMHTRQLKFHKKTAMVEALTSDLKLNDMWKQLFLLLIKNSRFLKIDLILSEIRKQIYAEQGIMTAKLKLASKQDENTTKKIGKYLEKILDKKVLISIEYDKKILGGFYAETESLIIDGSLRYNLKKFVNNRQKNSDEV
jgi:ATP synthase F1 delta subunit